MLFFFFLKRTSSKWIECKSKRDKFFLKNRIKIERARVRGTNKNGRDVFLAVSWRWLRTQLLGLSWAGHSTRRNISFKRLWKWFCASLGWTIKRRSLAESKLLEAHKSEVMNLGKGVQSQRWFCRQTLMPWILCEQLLVASANWWTEVWRAFFLAH